MKAALQEEDGEKIRVIGKRGGLVTVYNSTRDTCLGAQVQVADSSLRRLVGLLLNSNLESGSGLLLHPSNSIHTFGMRFPIDVIFVDGEFRVRDVCACVQPFRVVWPRWKAKSVLELPTDTIRKTRTRVGDQLLILTNPANAETSPDSSGTVSS